MFTVPDAKRIKRSHLFQNADSSEISPASSRSSSPEEQQGDVHNDVEVSYGFEYEYVAPKSVGLNATTADEAPSLQPADEADEPEYQFRLFAPGPKGRAHRNEPESATTDVKIRLSATPEPTELAESLSLDKAHFVRPNRPDEYYFTSALPEETIGALRSQYADAATSTSDILLRAQSTKWPGTALPWRMIKVKLFNKPSNPKAPNQTTPAKDKTNARSRPSKKRRILYRRRLALRSELTAQSKVAEETEREKRTRRNREKKVKKKEREKRKKLGADGGEDGDNAKVVMPSKEREMRTRGVTGTQTETEPVNTSAPSGLVKTNANNADKPGSSGTSRATAERPQEMPPARRAPTSRAPTAAKTAAPAAKTLAKPRAPTSAHPTKRRS
ncbi:hypothetical protein H2200_010024 [Cladophialophora chaetospira]|uniref:Uncharacterized protein n=1 Tax=Cladophialophora chaetospira TaxID=386627 RepID=A0AA38X240_9EURO|nr:hypothetical protein H2200_010024 [Cladophialophora chaetospira]